MIKKISFWQAIGWSIRVKHYWYFFPAIVLATTYGDIIYLDRYTDIQYLLINLAELFMLFLGISIGYWTRIFETTITKRNKRF